MSDDTASVTTASKPTSVYRYYDAKGMLIYVGVTSQGAARNLQHVAKSPFWPYVAWQEVDHLPTRPAALTREKALIRRFRPPFNTQHNLEAASLRVAYEQYATQPAPVKQDFITQYRELDHRLPLQRVHGDDSDSHTARFVTHPDHFSVASTLVHVPEKHVKVYDRDGVRAGALDHVEFRGLIAVVTLQLRKPFWSYTGALADLRVITMKQPVRTRVASLWVFV